MGTMGNLGSMPQNRIGLIIGGFPGCSIKGAPVLSVLLVRFQFDLLRFWRERRHGSNRIGIESRKGRSIFNFPIIFLFSILYACVNLGNARRISISSLNLRVDRKRALVRRENPPHVLVFSENCLYTVSKLSNHIRNPFKNKNLGAIITPHYNQLSKYLYNGKMGDIFRGI